MPAKSKKQQEFMAIQLAKKRRDEPTKVKMTEKQLHDFASTKRKGLPNKTKKKK